MTKSKFLRFSNWLWKEREYFDTWSLNHFLSGVVLAIVLMTLEVSLGVSIAIALGLFVAWELFEGRIYGKETFVNQVTDVFVDSAGFALGFYLGYIDMMTQPVAITITMVYVALLAWGYLTILHKLRAVTS